MGQKMEIDLEWVALIQEALGAGISESEITDYLRGNEASRDFNRRRVVAG